MDKTLLICCSPDKIILAMTVAGSGVASQCEFHVFWQTNLWSHPKCKEKQQYGRENWANAGEGNEELDMTLPRQVLATHRTPCRRFRIRLHLRLSRRSSPFCKAPQAVSIFRSLISAFMDRSRCHSTLVRVTAKALARRSRLRRSVVLRPLRLPGLRLR